MNVIDLRDELYKRRIEIIEITADCVYYAEELSVGGEERIYIYSYDFSEEEERALSFFTLESAEFIEHFYACGNSIIVVFENDSSSVWIVKLDKNSGEELVRRKASLIGRYFDCVPIDENNIIIYTRADDEHRELFNRCFETTNSGTMANLYELESGYRYFIKDFKTAELIERGMHSFTTVKGEERLLLCDPYCGEAEKEELVAALSSELSDMTVELRDNIWTIPKKKLLESIKSGTKKVTLRRAASAGLEGTVRFECICGDKIIFRAKVYKSKLEQFFEMSASNGKVKAVCTLRPSDSSGRYFTDLSCGKIYYVTKRNGTLRFEGEVESSAEIVCPERVGSIISCINDRYIIADKGLSEPRTAIFDSKLRITDTFQAKAKISGEVVILY